MDIHEQPIKHYDDFEWQQQYPQAYKEQTEDLENEELLRLPEDAKIVDGKLQYSGEKRLVKNLEFLYETMYDLNPSSAFEVGFGYCNHLINLHKVLPDMKLGGCDISSMQMDGAHGRYGLELANFELYISDFLNLNITDKFECVYSQAVVMHMSTQKSMDSIERMCEISSKYVFCIDGGLVIPNIRNWLERFSKVTYFDDWASFWTHNNISPFIIEVT